MPRFMRFVIAGMLATWSVGTYTSLTRPGGPNPVDWVFVVGTLPVAGYFYWDSGRPRKDSSQDETYARVREAEQGLEDALRASSSVGAALAHLHRSGLLTRDGHAATDDLPAPDDDDSSAASASETLDHRQARLTLSELWAVTHRRLDHYHGIALGQAKQSFLNAQIAMGLGFALLIGFVVVALKASTVAGSIVAGGLGAVSAALSGYVSRTFIRSQEAAAGHLRAYFDQPLEFSRYLAAERLMADAGLSEEHRAEVLSLLVQTMIAGPSGPTPASTNEQQTGPPSSA
ncbi:hypothetical protein [Streptomyces canus]|uniref:hypothetical protein n=1 Tax=Streptomyces canus TaxID=58343 RepID=UPI00131EC2FD|nr:hypothetical protein [Streptomyces canus]